MSTVTNVIVTFEIEDEDKCLAIDHFAIDTMTGAPTLWVEMHGGKSLECVVGVRAFNCLDEDELIAALRAIPWRRPECVQVFVMRQEETRFTELRIPIVRAVEGP